jgi:mycofactocin precursor
MVTIRCIVNGCQKNLKRREHMETEKNQAIEEAGNEEPRILEEIQVEELAIDGICGVY